MKMASRAVGNRRLLKLAKFLREKVPRRQFDYTQWVGADWKGKSDLSCGASACALGWATVEPSLRRLGLRLSPWKDGLGGGIVTLKGRELGPFAMAAKIFGLDCDGSMYLFAPVDKQEDNFTAKQVARKIEKWVSENPA